MIKLRRPKISQDVKVRVVIDYMGGFPIKVIAKRYGISLRSIYNIIHEKV